MLNAKVQNDEDFAGTASGRVDDRAPKLGVSTKRTGLCHPFRVVLSLLGYQGWLHATPGYSNGIPSGCGKAPPPSSAVALSTLRSGSATEDGEDGLRRVDCTLFQTPEYPEWVGMPISHSAGNEWVTRVNNWSCREVLEADADTGCRVRPLEAAIAMPWLNPALEAAGGHEVLRRGSSSTSGCRGARQGTWCQVQVLTSVEIPGSAAAPGSGCGFVLEDVGMELVKRRNCPEFGGGAGTRRGGVKAPEGRRSPRPGGQGSALHPPRPGLSEADPQGPRAGNRVKTGLFSKTNRRGLV